MANILSESMLSQAPPTVPCKKGVTQSAAGGGRHPDALLHLGSKEAGWGGCPLLMGDTTTGVYMEL